MKHTEVTAVPVRCHEVVLVCGKCSRKLSGGFGKKNRRSLREMLKRTLRASGRARGVRIVETKCLGLCPKDAVTMIQASQPGEMLAVPAGTDLDRLADRIGKPVVAS